MKIEIEVSDSKITNALDSAFSGGSNYWLRETSCVLPPDYAGDVHRDGLPLLKGATVVVVTRDEPYKGKGVEFHLNRPAILRGLHGLLHHAPQRFGTLFAGRGDATDADAFLQCCLFGEIVYG